MTKLPIKYIIVEGPDCSGKTSLCSELNKEVGFIRNIRDRSYLSTLCYARLYGRDCVEDLRRELRDELCDANNFVVVMLPEKDVILSRLLTRGDDYQDSTSLMRLYDIFSEEVEKISILPNVLVVRNVSELKILASQIHDALLKYESQDLESIGSALHTWTSLSRDSEVQFKLKLNIDPDHNDPTVMEDPHELEYYRDILSTCSSIVDAEVAGRNPYGSPQGINSRRFYYSSNTCISSIHFMPRDGNLKVICSLRSTDSVKNGSIDLRFLAHAATSVSRWHGWHPAKIILEVNYNSLHVRQDLL